MIPGVLSENAKRILEMRYIDKEHDKTIDGFWDRVSLGNSTYKQLLSNLYFLPNSPTLFNVGIPNGKGTLSACFVFDIADELLGDWPKGGHTLPGPNSILGTLFKAAAVAKAGGGVGYYLGNIRPRGAYVNSTHRKACGPVQVIRFLNQLRGLITQGGKRDLAQMAVLNSRHRDILEFINCKNDDPQGLGSFNLSVSWMDEDIKQINPNRYTEVDEGIESIWWSQCKSAWKTGCPGMLFYDRINRDNPTPHLGNINATNPCGETPNINNEPCNLGSIAVCRFVKPKIPDGNPYEIEWGSLKQAVRQAISYMDAIQDQNVFPHPHITEIAFDTRKLGLGVMGWADLLALLHIPYNTNAAIDLAIELMKTIKEVAQQKSVELAESKSPYPAWDKGDKNRPRTRNATQTSIAPTGTISIIANVWGSIEPYFAIDCSRTTHEGVKLNDGIADWIRDCLRGFTDHMPLTASQIQPSWHIKHMAAFQKYTDLGVSKTVNMPNISTIEDVSRAYHLMHQLGCKGGTIFRDGCRDEQVLVTTKTKSVYLVNPSETTTPEQNSQKGVVKNKVEEKKPPVDTEIQEKRKLPMDLNGGRHRVKIGEINLYIHYGEINRKLVEIFLTVSPGQGSTIDGMVDAFAKTFSRALSQGVPLKELCNLHRGSRFEPCGFTGNPDIPKCTSITDYIVQFLEKKYTTQQPVVSGLKEQCPDCQSDLLKEGNCWKCLKDGCGYSKC